MRGRWGTGLAFTILMVASLALPAASPAGGAGLPPTAPGTRAMWLWTGAEVDAATRTTYSFAGIAVHHYEAWRDLPA